MADNITQVNVVEVQTGKSGNNLQALKQQIKELKSELLGLEQGTEEYNQKLLELGNSQHKLVEVQEQMRMTNQDFGQTVSNVTKTIGGMSGAVSAITGTLALMGVQIGDDAKLMKILVAAMSVTQGVAAIDAGVKAVKALGIAIKAATVEQKGFNLAALKNPYIIAGAAIIGALLGIVNAIKKAEKAEKEWHDKMSKDLDEHIEKLRTLADLVMFRQTELAVYRKQVSRMTQEEIEKEKEKIQLQIEDNRVGVESLKLELDKRKAALDSQKAWNDMLRIEGKLTEGANSALKQAVDDYNRIVKVYNEYAKGLRDAKGKLEVLNTTQGKANKQTKDNVKDKQEEYTLYEKITNQIALYAAQGAEEIDVLNRKISLEKTQLTMLEEGTKEYDKQLVVIAELEKEREKLLNTMKLSNIESEKQHKLSEAETKDLERQQQLMKTAKTKGSSSFASIEEQREQALALAQMTSEFKMQSLQENFDIEKEALDNELLLTETTEERKREIMDETRTLEAQYNLERLQAEQELADEEVRINSEAMEKKQTLMMNYVQVMSNISSDISGILSAFSDNMEQGTKEWKALKTAEAIITTLTGGVAAMMSVWTDASVPTVWAKIAMMATLGASTLAAGFAQVKKIQETKVSKSGGGANVSTVAVQRIANNPSNVRTTSPTWNDEGEISDELQNGGNVTLVYSELEAMGNRKVQITNANQI